MATTTLTDQNIASTYAGLIHAQGAILPASSQVLMYDGDGNATSISLGRAGYGMSVSGVLSSQTLKASGLTYPTTDGTDGQVLKTDGAGTLSLGSILSAELPTMVPDPSNTYTGLSSITVDAKGRVTNVTTSVGGGALTSQVRYVTPIDLIETTNVYSGTVDCTQSNIPDDATYAVLRIEGEIENDQLVGYVPNNMYMKIDINSVEAQYFGTRQWSASHTDTYAGVSIWYAKLDGSNQFQLDITRFSDGDIDDLNIYTKISLLGFANFQELSNP